MRTVAQLALFAALCFAAVLLWNVSYQLYQRHQRQHQTRANNISLKEEEEEEEKEGRGKGPVWNKIIFELTKGLECSSE